MTARYSRRRALALGLCGAATGVLLACAGGGRGRGATPGSGDGLEIKARPKAAGKRPAPGVLRLGRIRNAGASPTADTEDVLLAYARLIAVDPRGPTVYQDMARAVEQPEPQVVRFTLRDGQRFHPDGTGKEQPLGADAVRTDFQRRAAEGHPLFTDVVDRIDRPDSRMVVLRLKAPFGLLFELLGAPSASVRGNGAYAGTTEQVGSGAWVPQRRDGAVVRYAANPAAGSDERPLLSAIDLVAAHVPSELEAAFARGEFDVRVSLAGSSPAPAPAAGGTVQKRPARRLRGLGLSLLPSKSGATVRHVPAFQDARVRRAIGMALNREPMLALDGSYASGPVGPAFVGDAIAEQELLAHPLYRHDPGEARKLVAAAGVGGLAFRLALPDLPLMVRLAQIIAENLQEIGLQPRLQNLPFDAWQKNFLTGDFESVLFDVGALDSPDIGLRLHTTEGIAGRFSLWGYSNPMYDVAVRAAFSAFDPKERAQRSREAQRLLLDDGPAMFPIGAAPEFAEVAPAITGYQFDAYDVNAGYLSTGWTAPQRA
ncbi:MAG: ABC transporter substrate-binding protein [Dehalococcoidia bacterium]|nr:ABC transporter substrate-binding protein [Dehalococcoidia bacterium]